MKKLTTLALMGLVAVAASASASVSRWDGFGASNAYIADVQDIWTLPGAIVGYKNSSYFELGESGTNGYGLDDTQAGNDVYQSATDPMNVWGGAHAQVGPGVLGVWAGRKATSSTKMVYDNLSGFDRNGWFTADANINYYWDVDQPMGMNNLSSLYAYDLFDYYAANGRVDLFYGMAWNDKLDIGLHLSRANFNFKHENGQGDETETLDANALGLGAGVEIKEISIFKLLEVGLNWDQDGISIENFENPTVRSISITTSVISARVGGDVAGSEGKFGRLEVGYETSSGTYTANPDEFFDGLPTMGSGNRWAKYDALSWNLGYAMGKSNDKAMGLVGLMLKGTNDAWQSDFKGSKTMRENLRLELSTAGEIKLKSWLTGRMGLSANLLNGNAFKEPVGARQYDVTTLASNGATVVTTGLSLNLGDLTIDGVLNQDLLYTGGHTISGIQETLFSKVSATWGW